jgi:ribosomal protein S18 acetylase RimI-like enzyme
LIWTIELLSQSHDIDDFDCGEQSLNDWLRRFALGNTKAGLSRTFVALEMGSPKVRGYFAVSTSSIKFDSIPGHAKRRLPKYPIPTVHIGRLAVDKSQQKRGLGETLLIEALRRAGHASANVGVYAVDVVALNDRARSFYQKYGFTSLLDDQLHLFLPIETARILAGIVDEVGP